MRRLILRIHLVIALIAGAFLVLLGLTGSILAFQPELDRLLHRNLSYVARGGRVLSLVEIGEAVSRKFNGEPIVAFLPATSPHFAAQVILSRGIVSVNQYTGEVLGVRTRGQTFLGFVRALHVRLAGGDVGRGIVRWSAVAMLFSLVSGFWLWWPAKKVKIRGSWRSARFWFDLHQAAGILSLVPLVVLTATGTVMGFEHQAATVLDKLTRSAPGRAAPALVRPEPPLGAAAITPDQAVALAQAQLPDAVPYRVQMPRFGGVYVVALEVRDRVASEEDAISIDPRSGNVLAENLFSMRTATERLMALNRQVHTGEIFGMLSKLVAAMAGIVIPLQAVTGAAIWLRRRKASSVV